MNTHQAKKDLALKLTTRGIPFEKLTARTVSFMDLARENPVFVTIHGATIPREAMEAINAEVPKPSAGGYVIETQNCKFV